MKLLRWLVGLLGTLPLFAFDAQADQDIPRSSGVITVRGEPHTYLAEGKGEPCIVVGFAPQYPALFSTRLKQHISLIYVDYKNSWDALDESKVQATTLDSLVEEIDDVRKAFALERVCVLGHSTPGLVAIEYAARHPERTSRLILVAVTPFYNRELTETSRSFWEADASPERKAVFAENLRRLPDSTLSKLSARDAFALRYARMGPRLFFDPKYDFYWAWIGHQFSAPMLDRFWKVIVADYNPWSRLSKNTVPTLVVLGRYDYAVPYRLWDRCRSIPGLTFVTLERSAHFPMIEEPQRFDAALTRWLAQR
ncbi:MAG TPA: alpha/beta hydrolase [Steroidobacteraceae bacterium]|jgi:proline iminopeptidase|nr:alpha/beta hydrolase [Steroidobacteraceae bacterium]